MSGDLISREEAIDIIENYPHGEWNVETMNDVISKIKSLSSAKQKKENKKCPNKLPCGWCGNFDTQCWVEEEA